jgi:isoleucyl-tRNA synthetase
MRATGPAYELLRRHEADLRYIFIVSQVELEEDPRAEDGLQIEIFKADGQKCERCWNYSVQIGLDESFPTLCERCVPAVREIANYE